MGIRKGYWLGVTFASALATWASSGCVVGNLTTADRMKNGLVLILPGIEGRSKYNADLLRGLDEGGVPCAIEIFDWGTIVPLGGLVNLVALDRNRDQARHIADRIVQYQQDYPDRPVHLVGHSGGGGLAVLALEALPPGRKVNSATLLAAAISPDYDLTRALNHTEAGIWNFYSNFDVGYLTVGTSFFGTIDRRHTRAAGAVGFKPRPATGSRPGAENAYARLHSVSYKSIMAEAGNRGSHAGWTNRRFVALWIAPVILASSDARAGYYLSLDDRADVTRSAEPTAPSSRPSTGPATTRPKPVAERPTALAPPTDQSGKRHN
jgi:pimeloyl-ACP methyl ester carboxylesterase